MGFFFESFGKIKNAPKGSLPRQSEDEKKVNQVIQSQLNRANFFQLRVFGKPSTFALYSHFATHTKNTTQHTFLFIFYTERWHRLP